MSTCRSVSLVLLAAVGPLVNPAFGFRPDHGITEHEIPVLSDAHLESRASAFLDAHAFDPISHLPGTWFAQPNPRTGTVHFAYGRGISLASFVRSESHAVELARGFLLTQSGPLGTRSDNTQMTSVFHHSTRPPRAQQSFRA